MLEVDLEDRVGDVAIDVSFTVERGEVLAIEGRSGSGKTTLLRAIAGLRSPASGRIAIDGVTWFDSASGDLVPCELRRVGFVFQEYALFPTMTARANVTFALGDRPRRDRRDAADAALERVGLAGRADHRPSDLSGGERQRLALARAIASEPVLLLLDEPLASLDPATSDSAFALIEETVARLEVPCLLVTHDRGVAGRAGRILRLESGWRNWQTRPT